MDDFRQNYLSQFVEPLEKLRSRISDEIPEGERRDAFRLVHTIKGCSRTFGLRQIASIAADLESSLAEVTTDRARIAEIAEDLARLIASLTSPDSAPLAENRRAHRRSDSNSNLYFSRIRSEIFKLLSRPEKSAFLAALKSRRDIFVVRESVGSDAFADEFAALRRRFSGTGEILAVFPVAVEDPGRTGLEVIVANPPNQRLTADSVERLNIDSPDDDCVNFFMAITKHVHRLRSDAAKTVRLDILADDRAIQGRSSQIFEILLHLTSNAVDHGIRETGCIEIALLRSAAGSELSVADDGCGIADQDSGTLFEPGFTTLAVPAANSGRGFGLFGVRSAVADLNGKISVFSRKDFGTRFEITLPEPL